MNARSSMRNTQVRKVLLIVAAVTVVAFAVHGTAWAESMSSTNYRIEADSINIGGNRSTSTNYIALDTIGESATAENLSSTNYAGCAGFPCLTEGEPFITFSVKQGTSSPGTAGAGVALGTMTPGTVYGSNGTTINSVFMTLESNAGSGATVTVTSASSGLARTSAPATKITSATANLTSASSGYGICVESVSQDAGSPTTLSKAAPYASTCDKSTNHNVGVVDGTSRTVVSSTGALKTGATEVLVKAKASVTTGAGNDYADTLTFIATGTY